MRILLDQPHERAPTTGSVFFCGSSRLVGAGGIEPPISGTPCQRDTTSLRPAAADGTVPYVARTLAARCATLLFMNARILPLSLERFLRSLRPRTRADRLQDEILKRMPVEEKVRLTGKFSQFLADLSDGRARCTPPAPVFKDRVTARLQACPFREPAALFGAFARGRAGCRGVSRRPRRAGSPRGGGSP